MNELAAGRAPRPALIRKKRIHAILILAFAFQGASLAGQSETVRLKWPDAMELVRGKRVAVATTAGGRYKGRVMEADADSLLLEKGPPIPRAEVAEIRLVEYAGNGRRMGKLLGGAAGLMGGLLAAVAVGMDETSAHKDRDKAVATVCAVGGLPGGLAAGYFLGRLADREVTIVRIVPETADTVKK